MNYLKTTTALLMAALVVACGKGSAPELGVLDRVPADSAYVFANLEPVAEKITDANLARTAQIWGPMADQFEQMLAEAEDVDPATVETITALTGTLAGMDSAAAVREQTGIEPTGRVVLYGLELFPVLNVPVHDQAAARDFIEQIVDELDGRRGSAQTAGIQVEWLSFPEAPVAFYWQVGEQRLTAAMLPVAGQDDLLARAFGDQRPEDAITANDLAALNNKHGFGPHGSGYFDLLTAFDQIVSEDTFIGQQARAAASDKPLFAEATCRNEIRGILNQAPRMIVGYTAITVDSVSSKAVWTLDEKLIEELKPVSSGAPIGQDPEAPFSMGLALNLGNFRDMLRSRMQAVIDQPFECSELQDLNASARQSVEQMNKPIPPLVGNVRGLRLILSNIEQTGGPVPAKGQGALALFIDNPQMVLGMARNFVPALASLDLKPGGEPQQIPPAMIPIDIGKAFVAASNQAIGLAVGEDEVSGMQKLIDREADKESGLMFSMGLDYEFYTEQMDNFADSMVQANEETSEEEAARARKMMKEMAGIYGELGYVFMTMGVNDSGLVIESSQRFE